MESTVGVKASSGKSVARRFLFKELLKDDLPPLPAEQGGDFLVVDFAVVLHSVYDAKNPIQSYGELYQRFKTYCDHLLNMPAVARRVKGVIITIDRQDFVPRMKDAEQLKRNEAKEVGDYLPGSDYPFEHDITMRSPLMHPYEKLLGDRQGFRQSLLRWLCWNLLCGEYRVMPPTGKFFGIYGHSMGKEDMEWRMAFKEGTLRTDEFWEFVTTKASDLKDYLLVVTSEYKQADLLSAPYWERQGEGEMQGFYLILQLLQDSKGYLRSPELLTTDTDAMCLTALFWQHHRDKMDDMFYTFGKGATTANGNMPWLGARDWAPEGSTGALARISVKTFHNLLSTKLFCGKVPYPAETLTIAYLMAGSDCTEGYTRLTHQTILKALFKDAENAGRNLFQPPDEIDPVAYRRILRIARNYSTKEYEWETTIEARIQHARAYFKMLMQHDQPESIEPDLSKFGYVYKPERDLWLRANFPYSPPASAPGFVLE